MTRKRRLVILAILVLAGASFSGYWWWSHSSPPPLMPPEPKAEDLEPAVASVIRSAREKVLQDPKSAKAWGKLGEVFLANELTAEARICLAEAERLDKDNPRWPYLQAVIFVNEGERESAIPLFTRAIELSKDNERFNSLARLVLAEAMLNLGQLNYAREHIGLVSDRCYTPIRSTNDNPLRLRSYYDTALAAMAREDWETARDNFQACLNSPYTRKKARIQLAAVCSRLNEIASANELRKEASNLPPDWDWPDEIVEDYMSLSVKKRNSFKIAENLESQGRFVEAVKIAASVVVNYPEDDAALNLLGRLLAQTGDFQGAESALLRAIKLAPNKVQHHYILGIIYIQKGEVQEAQHNTKEAERLFQESVNEARKAIAIKSDYGLAHMSLAIALKHLGKLDDALKEFREAVRCSPEYAEIHWRLAELLAKVGQIDEACARYAEAIELAPPGTPWREPARVRLDELRKAGRKTGS